MLNRGCYEWGEGDVLSFWDAPCDDSGTYIVDTLLEEVTGLVHSVDKVKFGLGEDLACALGVEGNANFPRVQWSHEGVDCVIF